VEVLRRNQQGSWYSTYQFWTQTDGEGRFKFEDLPDGDYLLGYEIWGGKPSNYSDYPTRYFPGVSDQARASIVHLVPMQVLVGKAAHTEINSCRGGMAQRDPAEAKLTSVVQW
jgi:hypothetical protein